MASGSTARAEVVIVGGGIAGASLAYALASAGRPVAVLERTRHFSDSVRGEGMHVWGVHEARALGIEHILVAAGGRYAPTWRQYRQGAPGFVTVPMADLDPDGAGTLSVRHPFACRALLDAATRAGATVVRGVDNVALRPDRSGVQFRSSLQHGDIQAPIVVGADGRNSTIRTQAGIKLEREEATTWIAGMLVERPAVVPSHFDATAAGDHPFLVLNNHGDRTTRVYLSVGRSSRQRYAGPNGPHHFLDDCSTTSFPWAEAIATATPAGPCATFPGDDTWTTTPYAGPVVLIGDAAGHTDPIMGQGLSIALRDARIVRDILLDRSPTGSVDFATYGAERVRRLERLRLAANIVAAATAEDATNRSARLDHLRRDATSAAPRIAPLLFGAFSGPERIPDAAVDHRLPDLVRTAS